MKDFTVHPILGYSTSTLPHRAIMLTIEFAEDLETALRREGRFLHFGISAERVRELAQVLLKAADAAEMGQAPTTSRN